MQLVSYAQNSEDVILWRALGHIERGLYIDVGAWWPDIDSVTRLFSDRGWRGINIEPNPDQFARLAECRPDDVNLNIAIGAHDGMVTINFVKGVGSGLSTMREDYARLHETAGWETESRTVLQTTLAEIWFDHVPPYQEVHFLKIDVEGHERAVLEGNDWSQNRPWVVILEATVPNTQIECHQEWEPILLDAGYLFAYADGLNRFYVSKERGELLRSFTYPPNVFDKFITHETQKLKLNIEQFEAVNRQLECRIGQLTGELDQHGQRVAELAALLQESAFEADGLRQQIEALHASRSWRATAPLRGFGLGMRKVRRAAYFGTALTGRVAYRALPVPMSLKLRLKDRLFERMGSIFATTGAYSRWKEATRQQEADLQLALRTTGVLDAVNTQLVPHAEELSATTQVLPHEASRLETLVPVIRTLEQRILIATKCRDADVLPKVANAGAVIEQPNGTRVQIMHNGIKVLAGGYCGDWMQELIRRCDGHHEPQEEVLFAETLRHVPDDAKMLELGGFWSFYSIWFLSQNRRRRSFIVEADPAHIEIGRINAQLNGCDPLFIHAVVGARDAPPAPFMTEASGLVELPRVSVASMMATYGIGHLDILHCDAQGIELMVLESCRELAETGRLSWVVVSTHSHHISGDALTHQRCLAVLGQAGATILAEHDVQESFSGDGLIVAKFGRVPAAWHMPQLSYNRASESLFRNPLYDLASMQAAAQSVPDLVSNSSYSPRVTTIDTFHI